MVDSKQYGGSFLYGFSGIVWREGLRVLEIVGAGACSIQVFDYQSQSEGFLKPPPQSTANQKPLCLSCMASQELSSSLPL